ncbi:SMP-30/gluconolactonase/LRE family protein [Ekhidna sp.]
MKYITTFFLILTLLAACQSSQKETKAEQEESKKGPIVSLELVWQTDSVMNTPEAVRFDAENNMIYVMNMGVKPNSEKDGDGTISKLSVDGEILEKEWVTGLNSPKGANFQNGKLYVADIDELVQIDIITATVEKRYPSIDPKFLNDTDVDENGDVYFTDTGSDQVLKLVDGEVMVWQKIEGLNPNGVFVEENRVLIISYGLGEFYAFNKESGVKEILATGIKGGDGIVAIDEGYLISTWPGEIFFVPKDQRGGDATKILDTKDAGLNAADITLIPEKDLLIVPTFLGNSVSAYKINID